MSKEEYDFHPFWEAEGISAQMYDEKVRWLGDRRDLGDGCDYFFDLSGRLYQHSRGDYSISNAAFFHAVIGLERAFKNHYQSQQQPFAFQFRKAIEEEVIGDEIFSEPRSLPKELVEAIDDCPTGHCAQLSKLVPQWRNAYFHGKPQMNPEHFFIALQLREIADTLNTKRPRI